MVLDRDSRSYRRYIIAVAGCLTLAAQYPDPKTEREQTEAQQSIANSFGNIATTIHQSAERAERPNQETEPCKPGDDRRYSDLCAQWKAADAAADSAQWAAVSGIVSIIGTLGVLGALGLSLWSNIMTRRAIALAEATARADLRPYVHPTMAKIVGRMSDGMEANLVFENGGRTPALGAQFFVYLSGEDWISATTFKPTIKKHAVEIGPIPPEQKRQRSVSLPWIKQAFDEMRLLAAAAKDLNPQFVLRGFVRYRDTFGARYITEFAYVADDLFEDQTVKMRPVHMDCPTYQQVDENDQPIEQA